MSTPFDDERLAGLLAKATPGPWPIEPVRAQGRVCGWRIRYPDMPKVSLAEVYSTEANAELIALAPELASRISEMKALLDGLAELLACSVLGGVHFMVEPELSYVDTHFTKRSQAHALSSLLCGLHPVDEEGCFVHGQPISEERVKELIELGNNYRATLSKLRDDGE